ncbi:MAG: DUF1844 domain-containing protein [Candidatus Eisenbacteria bacterium]|uniref:DUF1844 domain-containing protein n=1 Tax=Eiseniibacteriota bacterium TaxID=2212470 RepID=A0A948W8C9_UNCEI|nr:DUF1844 domain-containing protein [Candidatus Eisenbacteria bacterium]MBU1949530.1 DUF1844 domain-containing protein [Candidatus Eisenbacteria bacterium]MBU2692561.1 DUF1844 domain-containing protein [Candidatus Eisenbacteria bacterium]
MATEEQDHLFLILASQLRDAAWMGLGKAEHPVTGKTERNLDLARFQIDMLGMLSDKTSGRLNKTESQFLEQSLTQLRLAYVEEMNRSSKEKGDDAAVDGTVSAEGAGGQGGEETSPSEDKPEG